MTKKNYQNLMVCLCAALLFCCILSLGIGSQGFSMPFGILLSYRLNRIVLALIAGSALAVSGTSLQALLRNPLADPHLFGISGGSALGACICIAFFSQYNMYLPSIGAIIGGFLSFLVIFSYLKIIPHSGMASYLLIGVLINSLTASCIMLLKIILPTHKTQSLLFWLVGNITLIPVKHYLVIIPLWFLGISSLWSLKGRLEILSFGQEESQLLGVNTNSVVKKAIIANCLLIGMTTAFVGIIGFLGLVIPHCVRLLFHANVRFMLPISAVLGALVMVFFDSLSRLSFFFFHSEIPSGALAALFLSPLFFFLLVLGNHGKISD